MNSAFAVLVALSVTVQLVLPPAHAPDQPAKIQPGLGLAVRTTAVPSGYEWLHVVPQLMPVGELVTLP